MKKLLLTALACAGVALVLSGLSGARPVAPQYAAHLTPAQAVPKQAVKNPRARGLVEVNLVPAGVFETLHWKLTYSHLTGPATAAEIRVGRKGTSGTVLLHLCPQPHAPCRSGMSGESLVGTAVPELASQGRLFAQVRTAKNVSGEIRGQIAPS
jgi:hypothetical protein